MSPDDRRLLEFESRHPEGGALKQKAVIQDLGIRYVRYQQRLNAIARTPEAVALFPHTVHRMERQAHKAADLRLRKALG